MSSFQVGWFYFFTDRGGDLSIPLPFELQAFADGWLAAEEYNALVKGWL